VPEVDLLRAEVFRLGGMLDAALLQVGEYKKLVRESADAIYATGKEVRAHNLGLSRGLMCLSTEMHRQVGILDGKEPLPAAGERLTEKRIDETVYCTCFPSIPCRVPGHV
jgi:hypothetical protein